MKTARVILGCKEDVAEVLPRILWRVSRPAAKDLRLAEEIGEREPYGRVCAVRGGEGVG